MGEFQISHHPAVGRMTLSNRLHTEGAKRCLDRAMGVNLTVPAFMLGLSIFDAEQPHGTVTPSHVDLTAADLVQDAGSSCSGCNERIGFCTADSREHASVNPYDRKSVSFAFTSLGIGGVGTTDWVSWRNTKPWVTAPDANGNRFYANQSWWCPNFGYPYSIPHMEAETDLDSDRRHPYDRFVHSRAERYASLPIRHVFLLDENAPDALIASAVSEQEWMIRPNGILFVRFRCRFGFGVPTLSSTTSCLTGLFMQEAARSALIAPTPMVFRAGLGSINRPIGPDLRLSDITEIVADGYGRREVAFGPATASAGRARSESTLPIQWVNSGNRDWPSVNGLFMTCMRDGSPEQLALVRALDPVITLSPGDSCNLAAGAIAVELDSYSS